MCLVVEQGVDLFWGEDFVGDVLQLGAGQRGVTQLLELLVAELQALLLVLRLACEVDVPVARIAQGHCL